MLGFFKALRDYSAIFTFFILIICFVVLALTAMNIIPKEGIVDDIAEAVVNKMTGMKIDLP